MTEAEECAVRLFVSHYVDRLTASPGPVETQAVARGVAILLAERDAALELRMQIEACFADCCDKYEHSSVRVRRALPGQYADEVLKLLRAPPTADPGPGEVRVGVDTEESDDV